MARIYILSILAMLVLCGETFVFKNSAPTSLLLSPLTEKSLQKSDLLSDEASDDKSEPEPENETPLIHQDRQIEDDDDDDSDEQDDDDDENDDVGLCTKSATCVCGGIVNVTGSSQNATIEYGSYKNNERCVWTVVPQDNVTLNGLVMLFERQDFGNDKDGLIVYTWDGRDEFNGTKITKGDTGKILMFNVQYLFLYFSSDGSSNGKGFKATILGMPSHSHDHGQTNGLSYGQTFSYGHSNSNSRSPNHIHSHKSSDKRILCPTEILYPSSPFYDYPYNGKATWVLQSKYDTETILKMQYMDTYSSSDYLKIYQLPPYGSGDKMFILEGSYSGRNPESQTSKTKDPRILLFSSHGGGSGKGFHLTWSQSN